LLKNLEQNTVEQGQVIFFKSAAPHVHAHAWRRVRLATPARADGRPSTTAGAPLRPLVPRPRTSVHTLCLVAMRRTSIGRANRPCRRPTNHAPAYTSHVATPLRHTPVTSWPYHGLVALARKEAPPPPCAQL
jgi:hypothetical protein